jgi:phosphatidylethanolamine/phosphatidyl-N-methylethanolamine N-methyltransferase
VLRWSLYAPFYDRLISFKPQRRRAIAMLALNPGERVLVVGCGTGLDLPLLPAGVEVTALDLTPAMVRRARQKAPGADVRVMDAQRLEFADGTFDAVVLHLIVAVVPDPLACMRESARVLKAGGRACVFDKFVQGKPSAVRRILNVATRFLGTDINRNLGELAGPAGFVIEADEAAMFGGLFRVARLRNSA